MADQQDTDLETPAEIRDEVLKDLAALVAAGGNDYEARIANLAQAALVLDMVDARHQAAAPTPPPFDVDALIVDVWNATQDAGASTAIGDAAIEAIRARIGAA